MSVRPSPGSSRASPVSLQWVVTGYTLMFSAVLLFAGTLADRIGARRAYGIGMALFIAASAACGLGPSLPALVAARLVQGAGAARVTPTSLALIRDAYQDVAQRTRAIAYWAMGGSVAAAAGPVLGGALAQADWRLIFFLNLPAGAAAFTVLARVPASPRRSSHFDWAGQASADRYHHALPSGHGRLPRLLDDQAAVRSARGRRGPLRHEPRRIWSYRATLDVIASFTAAAAS